MEKELTIKDKVTSPIIIQHDDLKFDGKTITIPGYYVDIILDYIKDYEVDGVPQVDIDDYISFRDFLYDIQEHKNRGN
jgi:hypothetical protein